MQIRQVVIFGVFAAVVTWFIVTLTLIGVILSLSSLTANFIRNPEINLRHSHGVDYISRTIDPSHVCWDYENHIVETCADFETPAKYNSRLHGDLGRPVETEQASPSVSEELIESYRDYYGYNEFASELVGYFRRLPDYRHPSCVTPSRNGLGKTSIIITIYNEGLTTLFRTIISILSRTPDYLLEQIILVDDFSEAAGLKQLEYLIRDIPKITLIRADRRLGLIQARLLGVKYASAPVITFLDAHVEVTKGWLEPLLERVKQNPKIVATPIVDRIDAETMEYVARGPTITDLGGFDWDLFFIWIKPSADQLEFFSKNPTLPIPSPTNVGGIFSINKEFFEQLGMYDPELNIWGGEHMELSFKTWMCGGRVEYIPCSHVGHIYRQRNTYRKVLADNYLKRNNLRIASVWMDSYADFYYQRISYNFVDIGDTSSRRRLRQSLNCSNFEWYMTHVYPDAYVPKDVVYNGAIRNIGGGGFMCLDVVDIQVPASIFDCHGEGKNQQFWYTSNHEIRHVMNSCLDYFDIGDGIVDVDLCHGEKGNQKFVYDNATGLIHHPTSSKCMVMTKDKRSLQMESCNNSDSYQKWVFYKQLGVELHSLTKKH